MEPVELRTAVDRYASAVHDRDRAAFIELFTDDCVVLDPYPSGRFDGASGVAQWWDTLIEPMSSAQIEVRELYLCGDRATAVYTTKAIPTPGTTARLDGVDVFTITDDGRIARLEGYWDPATVSISTG